MESTNTFVCGLLSDCDLGQVDTFRTFHSHFTGICPLVRLARVFVYIYFYNRLPLFLSPSKSVKLCHGGRQFGLGKAGNA